MQRIKKVENATGKSLELLEAVKKQLGSTPNLFTTFANAPAAFEGYLGLNGALAVGKLNLKTREAIALTVAGFNGCDYCASAHTYLGINVAKKTEQEVKANLRGKSEDSKIEAALNFALRILETRGKISDEDCANIKAAGYSEEERIEILTHVALNVLTNYFNEAFQVEIDFPKVSAK